MDKKDGLFDLNDLSDLPPKIKREIERGATSYPKKLFNLFNIKKYLTRDEMLVGMARKYKIIKDRKWVAINIHRLIKDKKIKLVDGLIDTYEKIGDL